MFHLVIECQILVSFCLYCSQYLFIQCNSVNFRSYYYYYYYYYYSKSLHSEHVNLFLLLIVSCSNMWRT
jgi:hypothetical protein